MFEEVMKLKAMKGSTIRRLFGSSHRWSVTQRYLAAGRLWHASNGASERPLPAARRRVHGMESLAMEESSWNRRRCRAFINGSRFQR
jgi:hypothetical protein